MRARWGLGLALAVAALALDATPAEPRAGGGQSFGRSASRSFGSSRSWSSSSSSWGSGSSSWSSSGRSWSSGSSSWGSSSSRSSSPYRSPDAQSSNADPLEWTAWRTVALWLMFGGVVLGLFLRAAAQAEDVDERRARLCDAGGSLALALAAMGVPMFLAPVFLVITLPLYGPLLLGALTELSEALETRPARRRELRPMPPGDPHARPPRPVVTPQDLLREGLKKLKQVDRNFSRPLFMDFLGLLHARVAVARASGDIEPVRAYVQPTLAAGWRDRKGPRVAVDEVVLGAASIERVRVPPAGTVRLTVRLEASWLQTAADGTTARIATAERWYLERARSALSKGPRTTDRLGCPSCGASGDLTADGRCTYCDSVVTDGAFDWRLIGCETEARRTLDDADALVSGGEEVGTDEPTLTDADVIKAERQLAQRHPGFSWNAFQDHVQETFLAIQAAWTTGDLEALRARESHALLSTHRYWLERYRAAGLRNVLADVRVERVERVRCELDPYYESMTVRVFASMVDTTEDADGRVVSGDPDTRRRFSEYWTFIAAIGRVPEGEEVAQCPACGAPMTLAMAGRCGHCDALIVAGRFGWVLSRIEQDEAYAG